MGVSGAYAKNQKVKKSKNQEICIFSKIDAYDNKSKLKKNDIITA